MNRHSRKRVYVHIAVTLQGGQCASKQHVPRVVL